MTAHNPFMAGPQAPCLMDQNDLYRAVQHWVNQLLPYEHKFVLLPDDATNPEERTLPSPVPNALWAWDSDGKKPVYYSTLDLYNDWPLAEEFQEVAEKLVNLTEPEGSNMIGFDDQVATSPAFLRTVSDAVNGVPVSVGRFIPKQFVSQIVNKTIEEDLSPYFNDIINEFRSRGQGTILLMDGLYPIASPIVGCPNLAIASMAPANRTSNAVSGAEIRVITGEEITTDVAALNFNGCPGASLQGFTLNGVSRAVTGAFGIDCATHSLNLSQILIREFARALNGPVQSSTMYAVKIARCGIGVRNSIDTRWIGCHVIGCDSFGWQFQNGSNDNHLVGCKSDWNGSGVYTSGANNLVIVGCVFDRNERFGIRIGGGQNITIGPNVYRRNGRSGEGNNLSGHIIIENGATNFSIVGGSTRTGADDDGSGLVSPQSGIILGDCSEGSITGINLGGVVNEPVNRVGGTTQSNVNIINCQPAARTNTVILGGSTAAARSSTINISNGGSGDLTLANAAIPNNSIQVRKLRFAARNTTTGARSLGDMDLAISRGTTSAIVSTGALNSLLGSAFSNMTASVSLNEDASEVTVTITNNSGAQQQVTVAMTN